MKRNWVSYFLISFAIITFNFFHLVSASTLKIKDSRYNYYKKEPYYSHLLELSFYQEFFPNTDVKYEKGLFHTLHGQSVFNNSSEKYKLHTNIGFLFSPQETSESYVNAPEFYVGRKIKDGWFYLGRKNKEFSRLENEWNLGLWNSYLRKDFSSPIQQGRMGVHFEKKMKGWEFWGIFSPISIPNQSAKWTLENGEFQSNNRWFKKPPQYLILEDVKTPIVYQLQTPSVSDVVKNHQEILGIKYKETNFWAQISYAYKPMSSYHIEILGDEIKLKVTNASSSVPVSVKPTVMYHKINSYEMGWDWVRRGIWGSFNLEYPDGNHEIVLKQRPVHNKQIYGGTYYEKFHLFNLKNQLNLSYYQIKTFGDSKTQDLNSEKLKDIYITDYQYFFNQAYKASLVTETKRNSNHQFVFVESYIYSPQDEGKWFQMEWSWIYNKRWHWSIGLSALVSDDDSKTTFFSDFSRNDEYFAGVKYVF